MSSMVNSDSSDLQSETETPITAEAASSSSTNNGTAAALSTPISITDKEALLKFANCTSCSNLLIAPVLLCGGGHSVCSKCRSKFQHCPVCSNGFTDIRNLIVEAFLEKFASKCPFAKEGCNKVLGAKDWTPHQSSCVFRQVECCLKGNNKPCCSTSIGYSKYFKHLKSVHGIIGALDSNFKARQTCENLKTALQTAVPYEMWPLFYLEAYEKIFLTGTEIRDGNIFWWISIIGTPQEAQGFSARISLTNEVASTELTWCGPVFSFRWKPEQIIREGCLAATQNNFRLLTQERKVQGTSQLESFWNITFSVCKREPVSASTKTATQATTAVEWIASTSACNQI